jgi:transposase-like protein
MTETVILEKLPQCPRCKSYKVPVKNGRRNAVRYRRCKSCRFEFKGLIQNPPPESKSDSRAHVLGNPPEGPKNGM